MRIGFDATPLSAPYSGVGTYAANLLHALQMKSQEEIVTLAPLSTNGNRHRPVSNKTLWMQLTLPRDISYLDLDICHFTNFVAPLLCPCPTVITIHDMTLWMFPELHPTRRLAAMRPIIPLAAQHASAIIAVSKSAKADIVSILDLDPDKVHVVYEAPAEHFQPINDEEYLTRIRARYHLSDPFILYVGTLEPRKNIVRLLEAFAELCHSGTVPHHFVIIGNRGWKDSPIFEAVERLKIGKFIRFIGQIPAEDLAALYNLAEAFVFPSLYEGFGLPVIEAMACGAPVVTSRRGSLQEIADDAAEFIDPTDIQSIKQGLLRVLCDPGYAHELSQRGLQRAAQFRWSDAADQTRWIYRNVLGC